MSKLKRNLKIIYEETTAFAEGETIPMHRRYLARAFPDRAPGSGGWGVWDQSLKRFLRDAEVRALTEEQVRSNWVN